MIKKIIIFGLTLLWVFQLNGQVVFTNEEWKDINVFEINQTDAHTPLIPFADEQQALRNDRSATPYYMSLDGTWKFSLFDKPADVPSGFFRPEFRTGRWDNIAVPSHWQMEGFGHGKFRNIALTFISDPPHVPEDYNPTGSYVRTFRVPRNWDGREVFLHFEGVKSASYVWVNGQAVGYNQGGFEPAEYNVTPFIKRGENTIAVKVLSYSDGSYIENQDMWRLSGIFRSVYLFAAPQVHMRDYYVVTELDQNYEDAELQLDIDLVQVNEGPIKPLLKRIGEIISFFEEDRMIKSKANNNSIFYRYSSEYSPELRQRIKIEINCREHFNVLGWKLNDFDVKNEWFDGKAQIRTYQIDELLGTKLRALYQRNKGRDLFDLFYAGKHAEIDKEKLIGCYKRYMKFVVNKPPTSQQFLLNLEAKLKKHDFIGDLEGLLRPGIEFDENIAFDWVKNEIIEKL